jgi:hypothetical protein
VLASVLLLALFIGCMSHSGSVREVPHEEGILKQCGTVSLGRNQTQTIYYPITYVRTPNLTISDDVPHYTCVQLVEQKWDHFTLRRDDNGPPGPLKLRWTAKGIKGMPGSELQVAHVAKPAPVPVATVAYEKAGVITQSGAASLHGRRPQTIYYPIPYASTPNLTLENAEDEDEDEDEWEILEQQWDHFTVRRKGSPVELKWTAKGLKGPPPAVPVVAAPVSSPPLTPPRPAPVEGPNLPPRPIPVDSPGK